MKADLKKQDKILSKIGLKRLMVCEPPNYFSVYAIGGFENYVTSEYEESQRKETDEVYRMSEFNLLHIDSGLRLTLTATESYDGETEEYKVFRMFITTSLGKELEVMDADFKNEIFYTIDLEIPFAATYKPIEFVDENYLAPHLTKEEIEEGKSEGIYKVYLDLQLRRRKPQNKEEEEIFKEILDAEAKGYTIDLPLF